MNSYSQADIKNALFQIEVVIQPENDGSYSKIFIFLNSL